MDPKGDKDASRRLMSTENASSTMRVLRTLTTSGKSCLPSLLIHSLVVVFGISAWIGVNGIYVQLPLLVPTAPEGWNLAAYLVVVIQAANVGPAFYALGRKCCRPNESLCIYLLLLAGSSAMGLLAFFHDKTTPIGNTEHSVTLFLCGFVTALVGCTSSVLFMPYLRNSSDRYLVSYFIGEGLSGVLPSVVALFQGVGDSPRCVDHGNGTVVEIPLEPRFSSSHYFLFIFAILAVSLFTFGLLQYFLSVEKGRGTKSSEDSPRICTNDSSANSMTVNGPSEANEFGPHLVETTNDEKGSNDVDFSTREKSTRLDDGEIISMSRAVYLHILVGLVCFLGNGFLPGLQTFSCLPYGNLAFHLTVTLANVANPAACLFYLWLDSGNLRVLDTLTFVGFTSCAYAIYLAAMSPTPPLRDSAIGVALAVLTWVILTGIISYLKLFVASSVRQRLGPNALIGVGIVMQLGSACGAIFSFGLINYTLMFRGNTNDARHCDI